MTPRHSPAMRKFISICKRVLEAHGGTITAQNNAGGGATFTVILPK